MNRFAHAFSSLTAGFNTARLNHAFNHMSDRQLADIGLTRENASLRALDLAQKR